GPITLLARTTPGRLAEGTTALQRELTKLSDPQSFTDQDLILARKYWRVDAALEWERGSTMAHGAADHWSIAGLQSYIDYGDGIAARTVADVRQFVARYITGKPRVVGILT